MGASEKRVGRLSTSGQPYRLGTKDSGKLPPGELTVSLMAVRRAVIEVLEHKAYVNMEPWLIEDVADDVMWVLSGMK